MNIKTLLKRSAPLNRLNAWMKAYLQEGRAGRSLAYYRSEALRKGLSIPKEKELAVTLRQRLASRGIHPLPKPKGNLHIFLAYPLNNWESVLPVALSPFGRVTTFSWQSGGFFNSYNEWLKWRDDLNTEMLEAWKKAHSEQSVHIMIGYLSDFNTTKETLIEIGGKGAVIFNMCWDDKLYFNGSDIKGQPRSVKGLASAVDLNLTNAPDSCSKYFVEGGLAMFWPEAAHPDIHKPYGIPFEYDVSFVGGKYGWRPQFIERLREMGINITHFGNGWENGALSDEEMVKLYSRSRINLGFAGVGHSKKLMCLKGRDFEVPMSGGVYLTQNNPELSLIYEVGKEIVTYQNEIDCVEKINWLLSNPEEANKLRIAGRRRALRDHTWKKRFEDIFRLSKVML